jgi:hypothetical protein
MDDFDMVSKMIIRHSPNYPGIGQIAVTFSKTICSYPAVTMDTLNSSFTAGKGMQTYEIVTVKYLLEGGICTNKLVFYRHSCNNANTDETAPSDGVTIDTDTGKLSNIDTDWVTDANRNHTALE